MRRVQSDFYTSFRVQRKHHQHLANPVTLLRRQWGSSPEQKEEAVKLQHHSDDGPSDQHYEHAAEEEAGGLHLVLLEKEPERPLQADDERQTHHKQDLGR